VGNQPTVDAATVHRETGGLTGGAVLDLDPVLGAPAPPVDGDLVHARRQTRLDPEERSEMAKRSVVDRLLELSEPEKTDRSRSYRVSAALTQSKGVMRFSGPRWQ